MQKQYRVRISLGRDQELENETFWFTYNGKKTVVMNKEVEFFIMEEELSNLFSVEYGTKGIAILGDKSQYKLIDIR